MKPTDGRGPELPTLEPLGLDRMINFGVHKYWGVSDPVRFQALLDEARSLVRPGYFLGDNLFTWCRNNSLLEDAAFQTAWQTNIQNDADQAIAWRRYILACAAFHCIQLDGDFVECGIYIGTGIKTVADYLGGTAFPRLFWGYDSFDFSPVEGGGFSGQQESVYESVCQRFEGYPQVRLVKGLLPGSLEGASPERIAYLHIDLNDAAGEIATLEALFERVVPGGMLILDDYEWAGAYRRQKQAEDPWFGERGYRVIPLPTGQGLVIKR